MVLAEGRQRRLMEAARFREAARMGGGGGEQDDAVQGRSGRMATVTWMTGVALGGVASEARVSSGGSRAVV